MWIESVRMKLPASSRLSRLSSDRIAFSLSLSAFSRPCQPVHKVTSYMHTPAYLMDASGHLECLRVLDDQLLLARHRRPFSLEPLPLRRELLQPTPLDYY